MTSSSKTLQQKKIGQKPVTKMNTKTEKHRIGFDQSGFNDIELKIKSIATPMKGLSSLMKEGGIKQIDVGQLLRDPYTTVLPFTPEPFQKLAENLSTPELCNWDRQPICRDLVGWSRKNSGNTDLANYHSYYKLNNGQAVVDEVKIQQLKESMTRYTEGEKQAAIFSMVNQVVEILNSAQNMVGSWVDPYSGESDLLRPFRRQGNHYTVDEEFIRKY